MDFFKYLVNAANDYKHSIFVVHIIIESRNFSARVNVLQRGNKKSFFFFS